MLRLVVFITGRAPQLDIERQVHRQIDVPVFRPDAVPVLHVNRELKAVIDHLLLPHDEGAHPGEVA